MAENGGKMTLEVIGTGFGRTGTDSMRRALDILGFGPTHHMISVMEDAEQKRMWRDAAHRGYRDWEKLFAGYRACVDWPSALFWPELVKVYPDAKILLTWRTPESWWASMEKTLVPMHARAEDPDSVGAAIYRDVFGGRGDDRDLAIRVYEENVRRVTETVPAGRLLVHRLGDGWEPLCAHLGVPVPDVPYPHGNTTEQFRAALIPEPDGRR